MTTILIASLVEMVTAGVTAYFSQHIFHANVALLRNIRPSN
jgi:hypothetical protein